MLDIINNFPCTYPYKFIDKIIKSDVDNMITSYTFKKEEFFYKGHFPNNPITPGAILLEAAAQTLLAHGIYIMFKKFEMFSSDFLLTQSNIKFKKTVYPGDRIIINSKKIYFRHNKLKSEIKINFYNGELVCKCIISGVYLS